MEHLPTSIHGRDNVEPEKLETKSVGTTNTGLCESSGNDGCLGDCQMHSLGFDNDGHQEDQPVTKGIRGERTPIVFFLAGIQARDADLRYKFFEGTISNRS
jgi:hypothetical protein